MRAWLLIVVAGCAAEPAPPAVDGPDTQTIAGRHVVLTAPADRVVCGGTVAFLDDVAEAQAATLGLAVPRTIRYDWEPDPGALGCPPGAGGCTDETRGAIRALDPAMAHEIAHAILGINGVHSTSFFDEGDAVALGGEDGGGGIVDDAQPLDPLLAAAPIPGGAYATAGDLVSYLLATRGPAPFVAFLRATRWAEPAADVRAAFDAAYGESLDDVVAARRADPRAFSSERLDIPMCMGAPIAWDGAVAHADVRVDCATDVGPHESRLIGAPPTARRYVTVDVPAEGDYDVDVEGGGDAEVAACGGGAPFLIGAGTTTVHLAAGRLHVDLGAPVAQPTDFAVTITRR